MYREKFISQLISHFKNGMLPSLAREEPKAMLCMAKAHIETSSENRLPVEFTLGRLFDAVWLWGQEVGVDFPKEINHQLDFDEFCNQLMEPWPSEELKHAGLEIRLVHRSKAKINHRYEIFRA